MTGKTAYWGGAVLAVFTTLFLAWINLAVGIIGSEDNPANLMYVAVVAIGFVGALVAKFRPAGIAQTLVIMTAAHAVIAAVTILNGLGATGANYPQVIYVLNGFFGALWLGAAWFFYRAR